MEIERYGIKLRSVNIDDAEFIIMLRTDSKKSRFISSTGSDIELQKKWIEGYIKREAENKEYYFIAIDEKGEKFATYRVYNIEDDICEIGSWVSKPGYKNTNNSIKVDLIMKEFVFETLKYSKVRFEVNKANTSVVKYHKLFNPILVRESEDNNYFILEKENFESRRNKIFNNIK